MPTVLNSRGHYTWNRLGKLAVFHWRLSMDRFSKSWPS
jgi:hypothetical protein